MSISTDTPKRYHPALVALHWLVVLLIVGTLFLADEGGGEGGERGPRPNGFPPAQGFQQPGLAPQAAPEAAGQTQNIFSRIGWHMILGVAVLVLLVIRLIVRFTTKPPTWAGTGNKLFDMLGPLTHLGLYVLTFAMVISGILLADNRGILANTFGIGTVPTTRGGFSLGVFHGGIWALLLMLTILHVGASLYHQYILNDHLMGRMWFGKKGE